MANRDDKILLLAQAIPEKPSWRFLHVLSPSGKGIPLDGANTDISYGYRVIGNPPSPVPLFSHDSILDQEREMGAKPIVSGADIGIWGGASFIIETPHAEVGGDLLARRQENLGALAVARVLLACQGATIVLLMLRDEGPLDEETIANRIPEGSSVLECVAELRRCELVKFKNDRIALTDKGTLCVDRLRSPLDPVSSCA